VKAFSVTSLKINETEMLFAQTRFAGHEYAKLKDG
jgi:hypothetical protein